MAMNIILTIVGFLIFIIFGYKTLICFGWKYVAKIPLPVGEFTKAEPVKSTLEIQPSQKNITSNTDNNWNEEFFVYLVNNTNKTYYDINITSEFPKSVHVSFLPEDQELITFGSATSSIAVGSAFMLVMKTPNGMNTIQTVINNIGPMEKKKIKVTVNKENIAEQFNLKFKINGFSENPKSIYKK